MKFTAELDAQTFKRVLTMAAANEEEPLLYALETGLEFGCIDSSHVAMFLAGIPSGSMSKYECAEPGNKRINASNLKSALKGVNMKRKSDGKIVITIESNDKGKYVMRVKHVRQGRRSGTFEISMDTLQPDGNNEDQSLIKSFEHTLSDKWKGSAEHIPGSEFKDLMDDLSRGDDLFNVIISPGKIRFENPKGKDEGFTLSYFTEIESGGNIRIDGSGKGMYSTRVLAFFAEKAGLLPTLDILLGNNIPMEIEGEYRGITIRVLVAPRIEDHGEDEFVDDVDDSRDDDKDGNVESLSGHEPAVVETSIPATSA